MALPAAVHYKIPKERSRYQTHKKAFIQKGNEGKGQSENLKS